jgi:hypothetical protein
LIVATNNIFSRPEVIYDTLKVLLRNIPTDTPTKRGYVVVKGVMNRSQNKFDLGGLHSYDSILSLLFCHAAAYKTSVTRILFHAAGERTSIAGGNFITPLLVRDIIPQARFATSNPPLIQSSAPTVH